MIQDDDDVVELTLHSHHWTSRAILVSEDGRTESAVWLPLSRVEIETRPGGIVEVAMPEWLAIEKGLV